MEGNQLASPSESKMVSQIRNNPWILLTIVLGVLSIILILASFNIAGKTLSKDDVGKTLISFYEKQGVQGLVVDSVEETGEFYKVTVDYQGQKIPFYVTKTGYLTGNSIISLTDDSEEEDLTDTTNPEIVKSDKPKVELFIMTHCPYGTQAEKGIISVFETLGNSVDSKIRFVHYFMHGDEETQETYTQLCIR